MANCCIIFSALLVSLIAIFVGLYYKQGLPEELPANQKLSARIFGVSRDIFSFLGYVASIVSIGHSPQENLNSLLHLLLPLTPSETRSDPSDNKWMDIKDTQIARVPVRIYTPKHLLKENAKKSTGVIFLHGGGFMLGSVELFHHLVYRLAKQTGVVWISVDYRLTPKHIFPDQFDDCYGVVTTVLASAAKYGINSNRIVVAGDSAGGNLAAAVALKLRDENKKLAAQILIYPTMQFMDFFLPSFMKMSSPTATRHQGAVYWSYYMTGTPNMVDAFLVNNHSLHLRNTKYFSYIRGKNIVHQKGETKPLDGIPKTVLDGLTDYRASPLMADNMKGLPKTLLLTCQYDILKDDGLLFKARLQSAGVEVTHLNYMAIHGFLSVQGADFLVTDEFRQAIQDIVDYIKEL